MRLNALIVASGAGFVGFHSIAALLAVAPTNTAVMRHNPALSPDLDDADPAARLKSGH